MRVYFLFCDQSNSLATSFVYVYGDRRCVCLLWCTLFFVDIICVSDLIFVLVLQPHAGAALEYAIHT